METEKQKTHKAMWGKTAYQLYDPRLLLLVQELWQMHQRRMFALLE